MVRRDALPALCRGYSEVRNDGGEIWECAEVWNGEAARSASEREWAFIRDDVKFAP